MPVGIEVGGERALVGTAAAGTVIKIVDREGSVAHVELPDALPWLAPEPGARWVVELSRITVAAAGSTCRAVQAPNP